MWSTESVLYQIYPLGFCGAPKENDGVLVPRIRKVTEWIPHLKRLHADAVNPTATVTIRGTIRRLIAASAAMRILRKSVRHSKRTAFMWSWTVSLTMWGAASGLFKMCFKSGSSLNIRIGFTSTSTGGFWYEGWEGHFELVKLNLDNPQVTDYLFSCIKAWIEEFQIDGLRLDVAYCLNPNFMRKLRAFCDSVKPDFFLLGEILFGRTTSAIRGCTRALTT